VLLWSVLFVALIASLVAVGLSRPAPLPPAIRQEADGWVQDHERYAGAEKCEACHRELTQAQLASNHARTIRDLSRQSPQANFASTTEIRDPLTGARYSVRKAAGAGSQPEIVVKLGALEATQRLDFEFGSGRFAYGYLGKIDDGNWVDARLNYYEEIHDWGFTSGQDKPTASLRTQPLGRPQNAAEVVRCFSCHSTVLRADGVDKSPPDGSGLRVRPEHSVLGITCEACHGGRAQHVQDRISGKAEQPVKPRSAGELNALCGRCHGLTNVDPAHPVLARFQPWGMQQSRCFKESNGRLSCLTCHDPHRNASTDVSFYEAKCRSCHIATPDAAHSAKEAAKTTCPVNPKTGCVGCHMPRDSKSMLHVSLTDHFIRAIRKGAADASKTAR
jgi:hypothetical protein